MPAPGDTRLGSAPCALDWPLGCTSCISESSRPDSNRSRGADGFVMGFMIETLYTFRAKTVLLGQYRGAAKSDLASQWDSRSYHPRERLRNKKPKRLEISDSR